MAIQPGDLQQRITIERKLDARTDDGAQSGEWLEWFKCRGDVQALSGIVGFKGDRPTVEASHKVIIFRKSGLIPLSMRVNWYGRLLVIQEVLDPAPGTRPIERETWLMCKEHRPAPLA